MLDAAHRKSPEPSIGPRKEDIVESIIFKASDVVVVTFKDVDLNFARKGTVDKYYLDTSLAVFKCLVLYILKSHDTYTLQLAEFVSLYLVHKNKHMLK